MPISAVNETAKQLRHPEKAKRATEAMLAMTKFDIAA